MNLQTGFRLFWPTIIFGAIDIVIVWFSSDTVGLYALLVGFVGGLLIAQLRTPSILKQWERIGVPGDTKTPEQQRQFEVINTGNQKARNLAIVVGFIVVVITQVYLSKETFGLIAITLFAGLAAYFLRIGVLIYQSKED
jgi:hypothetical protein